MSQLWCGAEDAAQRCAQCGAVRRAGGYEPSGVIAETAHSRVYDARTEAGRVVIKELLFALAPTAKQIDDFEREVALLQTLDHPNLPRLLGHFREGEGVGLRLYALDRAQLSRLWRSFLERLCARDPKKRFESAAAARQALRTGRTQPSLAVRRLWWAAGLPIAM